MLICWVDLSCCLIYDIHHGVVKREQLQVLPDGRTEDPSLSVDGLPAGRDIDVRVKKKTIRLRNKVLLS